MNKKSTGLFVFMTVLLLVGSIAFGMFTYENKENTYTYVLQFGDVVNVKENAGLGFKTPFIQSTATVPKTIMFYDLAPSDVLTKDKKTMVVDCFVTWEISDPILYSSSLSRSRANAERRLDTTIYSALKAVIGNTEQEQVISSRDGKLVEMIRENIGDKFNEYGIRVLGIETKQLDLPDANKESVYNRMRSERQNIAAQYKAEGEAEATNIRTNTNNEIKLKLSEAEAYASELAAEGEAEYMKIMKEAYDNKEKAEFYSFVIELDSIKQTMKGTNKTLILSSDSPIAQVFNAK